MALLDKMFGVDEKESKLKQEIKSLELRKESVFTAINNEIMRLENEKTALLLEAGKTAYESWKEDTSKECKLDTYWEKIVELENQVTEQEVKKMEMGNRYDEEISLIKNTLEMNSSSTSTKTAAIVKPSVSIGGMKCPKCNGAVAADDMFCQSCGNKLK